MHMCKILNAQLKAIKCNFFPNVHIMHKNPPTILSFNIKKYRVKNLFKVS